MDGKIKYSEYVLFVFSIFAIIGLTFSFIDRFSTPTEFGTKDFNPFYEYYSNKGIQIILNIQSILWLTIFSTLLFSLIKKRLNRQWLIIIAIAAISLGILQWIEMWYGSTFYYGEVRDKQGLGVPIMSMILFSYVISRIQNFGKTYKSILIFIMIALTYLIFNMVKESWTLFYEIYIPGTSIPIW